MLISSSSPPEKYIPPTQAKAHRGPKLVNPLIEAAILSSEISLIHRFTNTVVISLGQVRCPFLWAPLGIKCTALYYSDVWKIKWHRSGSWVLMSLQGRAVRDTLWWEWYTHNATVMHFTIIQSTVSFWDKQGKADTRAEQEISPGGGRMSKWSYIPVETLTSPKHEEGRLDLTIFLIILKENISASSPPWQCWSIS